MEAKLFNIKMVINTTNAFTVQKPRIIISEFYRKSKDFCIVVLSEHSVNKRNGTEGTQNDQRPCAGLRLSPKSLPPVRSGGDKGTAWLLHMQQHGVVWFHFPEAPYEFQQLHIIRRISICPNLQKELIQFRIAFLHAVRLLQKRFQRHATAYASWSSPERL